MIDASFGEAELPKLFQAWRLLSVIGLFLGRDSVLLHTVHHNDCLFTLLICFAQTSNFYCQYQYLLFIYPSALFLAFLRFAESQMNDLLLSMNLPLQMSYSSAHVDPCRLLL